MSSGSTSNLASRLNGEALDRCWDFGDPAGSEQRFRRELLTTPTAHLAHPELSTQLARALGLQRRFNEALAVLDGVDGRSAAVPVVRIRLSLERGRVLLSSGGASAAIGYFADAWATARSAGEDFLAVDAAHMLAIADPARSADWTAQALQVVAVTEDPRARCWAGSLHNNAGWALHDAGDAVGALTQFRAALTAYSEHGTAEQVRVARWAVARALRTLQHDREALEIQLDLHAGGPTDGYVDEELSELFLAAGEPARAARHAAAALELLGADEWFAENEPARLERLRELSRAG